MLHSVLSPLCLPGVSMSLAGGLCCPGTDEFLVVFSLSLRAFSHRRQFLASQAVIRCWRCIFHSCHFSYACCFLAFQAFASGLASYCPVIGKDGFYCNYESSQQKRMFFYSFCHANHAITLQLLFNPMMNSTLLFCYLLCFFHLVSCSKLEDYGIVHFIAIFQCFLQFSQNCFFAILRFNLASRDSTETFSTSIL